jgi:hypothetical protein
MKRTWWRRLLYLHWLHVWPIHQATKDEQLSGFRDSWWLNVCFSEPNERLPRQYVQKCLWRRSSGFHGPARDSSVWIELLARCFSSGRFSSSLLCMSHFTGTSEMTRAILRQVFNVITTLRFANQFFPWMCSLYIVDFSPLFFVFPNLCEFLKLNWLKLDSFYKNN